MDYFLPSNRRLARLRCLESSLDAIFEKKPMPEGLCYAHSFELFEISPERSYLNAFSASKHTIDTFFDFRQSPRSSSPEAIFPEGRQLKVCNVEKFLLCCCRRIIVSEVDSGLLADEMWLEIIGVSNKVLVYDLFKNANVTYIQVWHKGDNRPNYFEKSVFVYWRRVSFTVPSSSRIGLALAAQGKVFRPFREKAIASSSALGEAAGHQYFLNSWEDVVDIKYGVCVTRSMLSTCIIPPNQGLVEKLRQPPSAVWDRRHDETLVQFLAQNGVINHGVGGMTGGKVWDHVEKIELSSSLSHKDDAIAALTDENLNTYWETDGDESSHYIRLHMKKNVFIEKLFITVDENDDSFLPQTVKVLGSVENCTFSKLVMLNEIEELKIEQTGDVCIYEATDRKEVRSFATVEIRILRCRDGGLDTRIRGLKIVTKQEQEPNEDLKLNIDFEKLKNYPLLLCSTSDLQAITYRAIVLKRLAVLIDSVLHYLVPKCELLEENMAVQYQSQEEDETDDLVFSSILKKIRFLLPLSHKRQLLVNKFLYDTEYEPLSSWPILRINRHLAISNRKDEDSTVFSQIYRALKSIALHDDIVLKYRWSSQRDQWWECKFIGEGVIDQGGGFRDSLCDIGEELCPLNDDAGQCLPYFIKSPNQHGNEYNCDTYIINPVCRNFDGYMWIGKLLGACFRTKEHLVLPLAKYTWKMISGEPICWTEDFVTVDRNLVRLIDKIPKMTKEEFDDFFGIKQPGTHGLTMTTISSNGEVIDLIPNGSNIPVSYETRLDYCNRIKKYRLSEGAEQVKAIKRGLLCVLPEAALCMFTWSEIERRISGDPEISFEALKKSARFEDVNATDKRVRHLWTALEHFSNDERSKFLRFVTGRRRLPSPFFISSSKSDESSAFGLPESSTCSNMLFLPDYPSAEICEEKLRYAIYNCLAIDTDINPWEE